MILYSLNDLYKYINQIDATLMQAIIQRIGCCQFGVAMAIKDLRIGRAIEGVYLLIRRGIVEYIGTSKDIAKRLIGHKHYEDNHVIMIIDTQGRKIRKRLETALVSVIDPAKNIEKIIYGKRSR